MSTSSVAPIDPNAECECDHLERWHLKHSSTKFGGKIRVGRCLSKVKNARGFPTDCSCKVYRPRKVRVA